MLITSVFPAKVNEPIWNTKEPRAWVEGQSGPLLVSASSWQGVKCPSLVIRQELVLALFPCTASKLPSPVLPCSRQTQDDNSSLHSVCKD